MDIDDRLLAFLPFYQRKLARDKPWLESTARSALALALEASGHARRVRLPDGGERLEPTERYLRFLGSSH